jgi:asparagine synthase (glutamine-hydrolysing)
MFADVHQLPAAHFAVIDIDHVQPPAPRRYWSPRQAEEPTAVSSEEAAGRLRDLFLESVRLHLRSDVPVGTALSGGIDSTAIVCAVRRLGGRDVDISGFTWVADDHAISEEKWVDLVGRTTATTVHRVTAGAADLVTGLDALIRSQGEPFISTSIFAQRLVFERAANTGVKVMLDGQGADELFGGYRTFASGRIATLARSGRLMKAARLMRSSASRPGAERSLRIVARALVQLGPRWLVERAAGLVGEEAALPWLNDEWFADRAELRRPEPLHKSRWKLLDMLEDSIERSSLPALLRYEDRNSMALSIESRVPFLTPQIAQFALSLPEHLIVGPDGSTKTLLRLALRGLVPDAILDRRDKIGFETPEKSWLRQLEPWVEQVLRSEAARAVGPIRLDAAREEWARVRSGDTRADSKVWRWLNLIRWTEVFSVSYG